MLRWLAVAGDGLDESAWARAFQISCQLPSLGQLAPPGPVKLPSRTPSGATALVSCQPPPAARPLIPSSPLSQELAPLHRRGFGECTKARGGPNRHWELSWRLLGQRAGHHDGRASASAPTAAADGRKVLSDGRGGTKCHLDGCSGARDRNLAALGADGAPSTRENLALRAP